MRIVRCNDCGRWIGKEEELVVIEGAEACPICYESNGLMDLEYGCSFSLNEINTLWKLFIGVPIYDGDKIGEEFLGFPAGTNTSEVVSYLDEIKEDVLMRKINNKNTERILNHLRRVREIIADAQSKSDDGEVFVDVQSAENILSMLCEIEILANNSI